MTLVFRIEKIGFNKKKLVSFSYKLGFTYSKISDSLSKAVTVFISEKYVSTTVRINFYRHQHMFPIVDRMVFTTG